MEGLRGFAVLLVFSVHYATLVQPWLIKSGGTYKLFDAVHDIGNVGVDLFFVLSGYLIYGGLIEARKPFSTYLRRRVQRIYPAFLVVFAIYLALALAFNRLGPFDTVGATAVYVVQNLLLLPGVFPIKPLITVAWSLSYEFFFYLLVPLVVALADLRARSREWRIGFVGASTVLALLGFGLWGGPVRMVMFLAGMLMHELLRVKRGVRITATVGVAAGLFGIAVPLVAAPGPALQAVRVGLIYLGFLGLCLAAFRQPQGGLGRVLSWTPLRWMGNVSYSYYLLHGLALQVFFAAVQRMVPAGGSTDWVGPALLLPAWVSTLPPCLALFLLIERPLSLAPNPGSHTHAAMPPSPKP